MTKITKLVAKTFNDKPSGFTVTLSDGRTGNLQEKESDKGLREGDEVIVNEIPYTSKAGKASTLYGLRMAANSAGSTPTPPQSQSQPAIKAPHTVNIAQMKFDSRIKCLELANAAYLAGKLTDQEAKEHVQAWVAMADGLIDEIFTK